eukprot:scaffold21.g2201.t1
MRTSGAQGQTLKIREGWQFGKQKREREVAQRVLADMPRAGPHRQRRRRAAPPPPQQHGEAPQCRICWEEADTGEGGALLTPCLCAGSGRHVHERCLREWMRVGPAVLRCNVCRADYDPPPDFQMPLPRPAEIAARLLQQARDEAAARAAAQRAQRSLPLALKLLFLGAVAAMAAAAYASVWRARHNYRLQVLQWLEQQVQRHEQRRRQHAEVWARMRARHEECVRELPRVESQLRWRRLARQVLLRRQPCQEEQRLKQRRDELKADEASYNLLAPFHDLSEKLERALEQLEEQQQGQQQPAQQGQEGQQGQQCQEGWQQPAHEAQQQQGQEGQQQPAHEAQQQQGQEGRQQPARQGQQHEHVQAPRRQRRERPWGPLPPAGGVPIADLLQGADAVAGRLFGALLRRR